MRSNWQRHSLHTRHNEGAVATTGRGQDSMLMKVAKGAGVVVAGVGTALLGTMLYGRTELSPNAQDGILVAQGVVLGGAAHFLGSSAFATALLVAPWTVAAVRFSTRWSLEARMQELVDRASQLAGPGNVGQAQTQTPAQTPAQTAPGGMPYYALNAPAGYPVQQNAYLGYGVGVGAG